MQVTEDLYETTKLKENLMDLMVDCGEEIEECTVCGLWAYSADFEFGQSGQFICEDCIDEYDITRCEECDYWTDKYGRCDCDNNSDHS